MLKSEDVAIRMQINFKNINFLNIDSNWDINEYKSLKPMTPFSNHVIAFLDSLSKELNKNIKTRHYPDVATFAFFCRKANLLQLKKRYNDDLVKLGRGIVFHIAPSNVPVNFAYSLIVGMLSGNSNIVRVPSKNFDQVKIIVEAINALSNRSEFEPVSKRIVLVRYDRSNNATASFSSICDVRIIWGGDETISQIRENALPPRAFDVTFSDRYSICVINADKYIDEKEPEKIANGFYNDTYLFDQNACTSPHLVIWIGANANVETAQLIFWDNLYNIVKDKYDVQSVRAIDKITSFYDQAIQMSGIKLVGTADNLLWRIKLNSLSSDIDSFSCNAGYFSEYHASSIIELSKIINRRYQTLAYYGFPKRDLKEFIKQLKPFGIDRMVPIGRTMDFSLVWDGYSLIDSLSRTIEIY
jgi:hypothetical protein